MQFRYVGFDPGGIPRVWAEDAFHQTAEGFAKEEAKAYVRSRPDTGPLSSWTFRESGKPIVSPK